MEHGLLLLRGRKDHVARWVRRGTVPAYVVPAVTRHAWTVVVPAGPGRAMAPYGDGVAMLAAHPLRWFLRPSVGLWVDDGHALVTCWPGRWRGGARWVRWTPDVGARPLDGLSVARPSDIAKAAGYATHPGAVVAIHDLLSDVGGTPEDMLADLAVLLGLPHPEVVRGVSGSTITGAVLVTPAESAVQGFDKVVTDAQRLDTEVEEGL